MCVNEEDRSQLRTLGRENDSEQKGTKKPSAAQGGSYNGFPVAALFFHESTQKKQALQSVTKRCNSVGFKQRYAVFAVLTAHR